MRGSHIAGAIAGLFLASAFTPSHAALISLDAVQTGGFFDGGGTPSNSPAFQNYFVGYGTTPGFPRTPERRSFFWFSLAGLSEPIVGATMHLTLPFGGFVPGIGPGDPPGPEGMEEFRLGASPLSPAIVTSGSLTSAEIDGVFESLNDFPIAAPVCFGTDCPGPPPVAPADIAIALDPAGIAFLNAHLGADVILTGWMPTWSEDLRPDPAPPPDFLEASELIFGLTDVFPAKSVPAPKLDLVTAPVTPVPEPGSALLLLSGLALAFGQRRWRRPVA